MSATAAAAPGCAIQRAGELLEVEGVAAALLVERAAAAPSTPRPSSCVRFFERERSELVARRACRLRCARSKAAARRSGVCRGRIAIASRTGADGGRRRSAPSSSIDPESAQCRSSRIRTSGLRRREHLQQLAHGAVGAVALVLERRARRRRRAPTGREARARAPCARLSSSRSRRRGSSPSAYSSSASTNTQNGRSRSSSDAEPESTRCPRASARSASSASRRVLPMPGSPTSSIAAGAAVLELRRGSRRMRRAPRGARRAARPPGPSSPPLCSQDTPIQRRWSSSQPAAGATLRLLRPARTAARRQRATTATASERGGRAGERVDEVVVAGRRHRDRHHERVNDEEGAQDAAGGGPEADDRDEEAPADVHARHRRVGVEADPGERAGVVACEADRVGDAERRNQPRRRGRVEDVEDDGDPERDEEQRTELAVVVAWRKPSQTSDRRDQRARSRPCSRRRGTRPSSRRGAARRSRGRGRARARARSAARRARRPGRDRRSSKPLIAR